ncbi:MAG: helix-turn-helix transcriptional regulator [Ruminococcaceae bacterium]|nr:helix-turn-helix transcriptional regulator [Oscillospiraceae bacterium]
MHKTLDFFDKTDIIKPRGGFVEFLNSMTVTDIIDIFTVFSPKGRKEKIVDRKSYALSFCASGQITYTHKGKSFISDPCHAIILPQAQTYHLYGDKSGAFPVINFTSAGFISDTMVLIPVKSPETYIKDFEKMKALSLFDGNRTKIMSIFYDILHRLYCDNIQSPGILEPAIEYLKSNYTCHELTNQKLADECNISEVYFRKLFHRIYNTTPKQYITDIRIDRAKQLLSDGILKINAVAYECGFSNQYHFCRAFKAKTGTTPTEYMKRNRISKI